MSASVNRKGTTIVNSRERARLALRVGAVYSLAFLATQLPWFRQIARLRLYGPSPELVARAHAFQALLALGLAVPVLVFIFADSLSRPIARLLPSFAAHLTSNMHTTTFAPCSGPQAAGR